MAIKLRFKLHHRTNSIEIKINGVHWKWNEWSFHLIVNCVCVFKCSNFVFRMCNCAWVQIIQNWRKFIILEIKLIRITRLHCLILVLSVSYIESGVCFFSSIPNKCIATIVSHRNQFCKPFFFPNMNIWCLVASFCIQQMIHHLFEWVNRQKLAVTSCKKTALFFLQSKWLWTVFSI